MKKNISFCPYVSPAYCLQVPCIACRKPCCANQRNCEPWHCGLYFEFMEKQNEREAWND